MRTRSLARKKVDREARKIDVKLEAQKEDRVIMPMSKEKDKKEHLDPHAAEI